MNPEAIHPEIIRAALDSVRPPAEDLDDASIACILDHGVAALPMESRARALRAIGSNPAIAAVVAELHEPDASANSVVSVARTAVWRLAFAACTLLATGATYWIFGGMGGTSTVPQLLDGSAPTTTSPGGPSGSQLLGLMFAWLLAVTCFVPAFVRPALAARRAGARSRHAGE
jgi:hypothetical protein